MEMEWSSDSGYGYGYDSNDEPIFPNGDGSPSDRSSNSTQNGNLNGTSSTSSVDPTHTNISSANGASSSSSSGSSQNSDNAPSGIGLILVEELEEELEVFFNEGDSGSSHSTVLSRLIMVLPTSLLKVPPANFLVVDYSL
ncbi:hypothetical protein N7522_004943 [Penicillium canescens]|uniref:Uncharacterized protein n=1 Tax=Penicillium canescens TaxID=5083 RepID=A0AAD6I1C0_PENCN|nr:uncharacterized protein N7446_004831 [Penicillium canescens]KAJ6009927.1 hypothetical protein N7522_004943 [Penicillium canescens]KAJ6026568.1 hypothetical protein N7460_011385 [Penicillium canescens]KAJ6039852.1 hypothetical protein N7444_008757 [Penicillium canescens]KAJ6067794.1 hypothetical protein N7446_004831 [Penicillium canescens]